MTELTEREQQIVALPKWASEADRVAAMNDLARYGTVWTCTTSNGMTTRIDPKAIHIKPVDRGAHRGEQA